MKFLTSSFIFYLILLNFTRGHPKFSKICDTEECHRQSKSIRSKLDTSVSPCDDFYQFSCGNYKDLSVLLDYLQDIDNWILQIASEPLNNNDDELLKLIKIFYKSCLSDRGSLNDYIEEGWNTKRRIIESVEVKFSWEDVIQQLQIFQNADAYIFSINLGYKDDAPIIVVDQPNFETKIEFLDREDKIVKEFYRNLTEFLVQEQIDRSEVEEMKTKAFEFEDQLLKLVSSTSESQVEVLTIEELQKIFKFVNWENFMKKFFAGTEIIIDENFKIGIKNREALKTIDEFLHQSSEDDILNYLIWRFFESAYITIFYENRKEIEIFDAIRFNYRRKDPCPNCICKLRRELDVAVAAVYARHFMTPEIRKDLTEIINSMKTQLFDTFKSIDWLDSKTKAAAAKKLEKMKFYVGYPDILLDKNFLSDYYKGLDITGKSLVQIIDQIARLKSAYQRKILTSGKESDVEIFFLLITARSITTPNALYLGITNTFMICAGLINNNTLSFNRPLVMNFGDLGSTIGHEILHGYDSSGRHFDENGNFRNWWGKEANKVFEKKSKCFVDQYGSYVEPVTGLRINGDNTLGENISDNGGTMLAYNTYQNTVKFDTILPNLNFTTNQLFWVTSAQSYCSNLGKNYLKYIIEKDEHTPDRFRVLGTFGNLEAFSKDFNCPKGSKMNRKNKCKIW